MSFAHKIRVGVLRGGPSPEYEVSLNTGNTILANLEDEYEPVDILISKEGLWHERGMTKNPYRVLQSIDVAINAMHGSYGEDGTVQKLLEDFHIPYTGSDSIASAIGMNKIMSKDIFRRYQLKTPHQIIIQKEGADISNKTISQINESLPFPIIIKPKNSGSSLGVSVVNTPAKIIDALQNSFAYSPTLIVEEFIDGQEITCGVIEGFRGEDLYPLLPVEIINENKEDFYNYDSKYKNLASRLKIPANITELEKRQVAEATTLIHQALGLRHYSRSDFILHPKRGLFVLEVNTLPELSHRSSFIKSLEALGGNIKEFLSHLLSKTLSKK